MNGERLELSGLNPFAGMAFVTTSLERMSSMSTKRNNDQPTNPVRAVSVGFIQLYRGCLSVTRFARCFRMRPNYDSPDHRVHLCNSSTDGQFERQLSGKSSTGGFWPGAEVRPA